MMTSVDNRINELIKRVRSHGAIRTFAFVPAYPPHKTPSPMQGYTVAVDNRSVTDSMLFIGGAAGRGTLGRLVEAELCLRVYAPEHSSGAALLRASAMLMDALEAEDKEREISELSLSGIGFDTASRTEFRDVIARLKMLIWEEE